MNQPNSGSITSRDLNSHLLFFYLAASLLCTPIPSPYTSSKVSDASTPIITAGIIWMLAKCHTLKSTRTHVESEALTLGLEIHCTLKLTNNTLKKKKKHKRFMLKIVKYCDGNFKLFYLPLCLASSLSTPDLLTSKYYCYLQHLGWCSGCF